MRILRTAFLWGLILGLVSCGTQPTQEHVFQSPLTPASSPTAAATVEITPTPLPSPEAGKGGATGQIIDPASSQGVTQTVLYLGELSPLKTKDGTDSSFVVMIPGTSPNTVTDEEGRFTFVNVEPGTYALVTWTPMNSHPITDPRTNETLLITVTADVVTDAGTIQLNP